MKQLIIVRKDLNMSKGKMAAQVSHASMAFLTNSIKRNSNPIYTFENDEKLIGYAYKYVFDKELFQQPTTKVVGL